MIKTKAVVNLTFQGILKNHILYNKLHNCTLKARVGDSLHPTVLPIKANK